MQLLYITKIAPNNATTIHEHVQGFIKNSKYSVISADVHNSELLNQIAKASAILLHYSVVAYPYRSDHLVSSELRLALSKANKPILHFVQDEQRNVLQRIRYFETIGVDHVFSVADPKTSAILYPPGLCSFSTSSILTGYVSETMCQWPTLKWHDRKYDMTYRARKLPSWYGDLGSNKGDLASTLKAKTKHTRLQVDFSSQEEKRLYGQEWMSFLCNTKVAFGTESGSSYIDLDGRYLESWQRQGDVGQFESVDPEKVDYAAISPRIFEYAAARCLMALVPGRYSDILKPYVHYFPIAKNLSNFADLIRFMNTESKRDTVIENAYQDLIASRKYDYSVMANEVDRQIGLLLSRYPTTRSNAEISLVDLDAKKEFLIHDKKAIKTSKDYFPKLITAISSWAMSRNIVIRNILRTFYRTVKKVLKSSIVTEIIRLFRVKPIFVIKDLIANDRKYWEIFKITKSPFRIVAIFSEIEYIANESRILSVFQENLQVYIGPKCIWICWPSVLNKDNSLKLHPRLDWHTLDNEKGVLLTRSDFSETSNPEKLSALSRIGKKNMKLAEKLINFAVQESNQTIFRSF